MTHEKVKQDRDAARDDSSCFRIFRTFFRIGLFTLGGGLAMFPVIRHELVVKRRWIRDDDFLSLMSLATVVPGVIAVNLGFLLGRRLRGTRGAIAAVLGTVLPSFVVIVLIARTAASFFNYPPVTAFFRGCALAIVGQLMFAGSVFGKRLLRKWQHYFVCAAGIIVVGVFGIHPLGGLIAASAMGYWLFPRAEKHS